MSEERKITRHGIIRFMLAKGMMENKKFFAGTNTFFDRQTPTWATTREQAEYFTTKEEAIRKANALELYETRVEKFRVFHI